MSLRRIGFFIAVLLPLVLVISASARSHEKPPARIVYSGNLQGEVTPCGCKHNKGGLPWRGGFLNKIRTDSMATLTVDMGNFSPKVTDNSAPARHLALQTFYSKKGYDAIGLSHAETEFGLTPWKKMSAEGIPIVVCNLFQDGRGKKPVFQTHIVKNEDGVRFAVIGMMSPITFNYLADKTGLHFTSPFEMQKFVKKVSKRADHVTLMGDFSQTEADSLAAVYPFVDLILTTGIPVGKPIEHGDVVIVGAQARGQVGEYLDWNFGDKDQKDSYEAKRETIDAQFVEDSDAASMLKTAGLK